MDRKFVYRESVDRLTTAYLLVVGAALIGMTSILVAVSIASGKEVKKAVDMLLEEETQ